MCKVSYTHRNTSLHGECRSQTQCKPWWPTFHYQCLSFSLPLWSPSSQLSHSLAFAVSGASILVCYSRVQQGPAGVQPAPFACIHPPEHEASAHTHCCVCPLSLSLHHDSWERCTVNSSLWLGRAVSRSRLNALLSNPQYCLVLLLPQSKTMGCISATCPLSTHQESLGERAAYVRPVYGN